MVYKDKNQALNMVYKIHEVKIIESVEIANSTKQVLYQWN